MRIAVALALAFIALLSAGCASLTQGTTHAVRIDTVTASGLPVAGADCTFSNDHGSGTGKSGSAVPVRRSGSDLEVTCTAPGEPEAKGRLVSRPNAGFAGNLFMLGGAIGALVDHVSGAAYDYPSWVRLMFGETVVYDQRDEHGTAVMMTVPPPVQAAIGAD